MWCFKKRGGDCTYILPNEKKIFGRTADELEGPTMISRFHASVTVEPTGVSETDNKCVIVDASKHGTFVVRNNRKITLTYGEKYILKAGDIVQFGQKTQKETYVVSRHLFVIAMSGMKEQVDVKKLKDIIHDLRATFSEAWEDFCTHLTVAENTSFTPKLVCALASAKPIVTSAYWEAVSVAVKESTELPKIKDFLPKVKEDWLKGDSKMLLPDEKRRTVFNGLSFIHFCPKQFSAYAEMIIAAGGRSYVYKKPLIAKDLIKRNIIVIQQPANDFSHLTNDFKIDCSLIDDKIATANRRMVSDAEIPSSILYCDTETYCNPKFNIDTKLETILIDNTQDIVNTDTRQIKRKIIEFSNSITEENKLLVAGLPT